MILHRHGYLSPDIEQVEAVIAAAICEALDEVAEMARGLASHERGEDDAGPEDESDMRAHASNVIERIAYAIQAAK